MSWPCFLQFTIFGILVFVPEHEECLLTTVCQWEHGVQDNHNIIMTSTETPAVLPTTTSWQVYRSMLQCAFLWHKIDSDSNLVRALDSYFWMQIWFVLWICTLGCGPGSYFGFVLRHADLIRALDSHFGMRPWFVLWICTLGCGPGSLIWFVLRD